jgi:branched-chain amino acid transport system permease protein
VLQYVIAGLVLGGIYAIAASGIVVTYLSAGILNFAFGAMAFFIARFYYYLHVQHQWGIVPAAVLSVLVVAPALGVFLYAILFRYLRMSSSLIKVVATLGLSVTLPPLATLLFGNEVILLAPGLAPEPVRVFRFLDVPVTMNQLIVYISVLLIVLIGAVVLRYSDVGLRVRAMVDSPAMTGLMGSNPGAISVGVWATATFLAGLTGVLAAPILGLKPENYTLLMTAAFAAVIAAKLRSLPIAISVGLLMGIAGAVIPRYLPATSSVTSAVVPSIPFAVTALFLVYNIVRSGRVDENAGVGGALDRAIAVDDTAKVRAKGSDANGVRRSMGGLPSLIGFGLVLALPLALQGYWVGLAAEGIAYGVLFLSITLVTGEGGMVWLCIATFAGVGAITCGQLATVHGWPVLLAVLGGGLVAAPLGVLLGLFTIRLGDIYIALVTLTFGLLMENLVFTLPDFVNSGLGVTLHPPEFARGEHAYAYLGLAVFAAVSIFIVCLRRSTIGLALTAMRSSESASKSIGVNVVGLKVAITGLAAFVAGVGGALVAVAGGLAFPSNFSTLVGVLWLAVVVTQGIRSNAAALLAGLSLTLFPAFALAYMPSWFAQVPPILFGLGAIALAKNPDGVLAMQARHVRALFARFRARPPTPTPTATPAPVTPEPSLQATNR